MKKKVLATLVSAAMAATMLAGCGSKPAETTSKSTAAETEAPAENEEVTAGATSATSMEAAATSGEADGGGSNEMPEAFKNLKANEAYSFPVIVKSFQSTYWQAALTGMEKAAGELGVTYTAQGPNAESDIADQVNMLNSAISGKPVGIGLAAADTTSVLDSLKNCVDQGIPVVAFDTGIEEAPEGAIACTVATDNGQAGGVAADHMYEAIKDVIAGSEKPVRIGEINQDATAQNIKQRGLGFINKMIELIKADGKTVAVEGNEFYVNNAEGADEGDADVIIDVAVPAQTTVELCATEAQSILSKDDTIAIFGSNQTAAEGVLAANANLNVLGSDAEAGDVIGIGFDAGSTIKGAVTDGTFFGAVTQSPLMMGYYSLYALTAAANGDTVEDIPTAGYWYDSTNMEDESIAPNLYD